MLERFRHLRRRGSATDTASRASAGADTEFIVAAFRVALGRDPDPDGLANFEALLAGGATHHDVLELLRESEEYQERHRPGLSNTDFLNLTYQMLFDRGPDDEGLARHRELIDSGYTHADVVTLLRESDEYRMKGLDPLHRLHASRIQWTQALPQAEIIVDLGGASTASNKGALIELGYPYHFQSLTIIDLPPDERHEEFRSERYPDLVQTKHGPVHYRHASMTDLSGIADSSVDLVNSGQTFEHIYPEEGETLLKEVRRVLKPTGFLALDTPNRALTEIQMRHEQEEFINPDHKIEYTHPQMMALFDRFGFDVVRAQGIAYMPESRRTEKFDLAEMVQNAGVYDAIEDCYLLAYLVRSAH